MNGIIKKQEEILMSKSSFFTVYGFVLSLLLLSGPAVSHTVAANRMDNTSLPDLFYGGNLFFSSHTSKTFGVSPVLGIHIFPDFGVGLGADYYYVKRKDEQFQSVGGKLYLRYSVHQNLYAKTQFSYLYYNGILDSQEYNSQLVPYLFVGGGYQRAISSHALLEFEVLFDVLQNENSLFNSGEPVFNMGVIFGL
jgi:hypothetical protein